MYNESDKIGELEGEGYLKVRCGPMFSKKTTLALNDASDHCTFGKSVLFVNNIKDDDREIIGGDGKTFSSHNDILTKLPDKVDGIKLSQLSDLRNGYENYDCYIIDEAQFFDDLRETVLWLLQNGKYICVYSLDGKFTMEPFGQVHLLVSISDDFQKITAKCERCNYKKDAPFTKKITEEETDEDGVLIGGDEKYSARCRRCYYLP